MTFRFEATVKTELEADPGELAAHIEATLEEAGVETIASTCDTVPELRKPGA